MEEILRSWIPPDISDRALARVAELCKEAGFPDEGDQTLARALADKRKAAGEAY